MERVHLERIRVFSIEEGKTCGAGRQKRGLARAAAGKSTRGRTPAPRMRCVVAVLGASLGMLLAVPAYALTLSGTVYGGGSPLPNTLVEALEDGTTNVLASNQTDSSGHYALTVAAGTYDLRVTPPNGSGFGLEVIQNLSVSADTNYDVILLAQGAGGLSGTLFGWGGNPVVGARVQIYDQASGQFITSQTTDSAGHYVLTISDGTYRVWFGSGPTSPYAPSSFSCYQYNVTVAGPTTFDFSLPVARVSGTVSGSGAGVLPGATVATQSSYYVSNTSCSGNETVTADSAGDYTTRLFINSSGYTASFTVHPASGQPYATVSQQTAITGDTTLDFVLPDASTQGLSGTISGYGGNPIAGASVYLYTSSTSQLVAQQTTDANGHYSFDSGDGTYRLYVNSGSASSYAPGYYYCYQYGIVASGPTVFDFAVPVVEISGTVQDGSSGPVANATVRVRSSYNDSTSSTYCYTDSSVTSDTNGDYAILSLSNLAVSDTTYFLVQPPSSSNLALVADSTSTGSDTTRDFVLPDAASHSLSGTLRGYGGNPVASAYMYVYVDGINGALVQTDANGHFSFAVGDDTYQLTAYRGSPTSPYAPASSYSCSRSNLAVSGVTSYDLDMPVVEVSGSVTDSNGAPVPGVAVKTTSNHNASTLYCSSTDTSTSDAGGLFSTLAFTGTASFQFTPPTASGFAPSLLSNVTLSADLTQALVLQRPDITPPDIVAGPSVIHLSDSSVSISWTTNESADSLVEYGLDGGSLTESTQQSGLATQHTVTLTNLAADSIYYFRVGSTDESGNGPTYSSVSTFTTQVPPGDVTPPVITAGPQVDFVDQTSALIDWTTDEPATSVVHFGLTNALGTTVTDVAGVFTQSHSIPLTSLTADTTYYYQVESTDPDGNGPTTSGIMTFRTAAVPDTTAPVISNAQVTGVTDTTITVEWDTDEPATSGVSFNDGTVFDVVSDSHLVSHHTIVLSSLTPSQTYHITVSSTDAAGNGPTLAGPFDATTNPSPTATPTETPTTTPTFTPTGTSTFTPSPTATPTDTSTSTPTPTPTPTDTPAPRCAATPLSGCRQANGARRASVLLKNSSNDDFDKIVWGLNRGDATTFEEFGDPLNTTSYSLCIYDEVRGEASLVLGSLAPAGGTCHNGHPCWNALASRGYKYVDGDRTPGGLARIILRAGDQGHSAIFLKGTGPNLHMPALPLSQDGKVTVQLVGSNDLCFSTDLTAPALRDDEKVFRDKSE